MKFFVRVFNSKKTGNKVIALCCDLGYTVKFLNFDFGTIAEILGVPVSELYNYDCGDYKIGD